MEALHALFADRHDAISGQENFLTKHELRKSLREAKADSIGLLIRRAYFLTHHYRKLFDSAILMASHSATEYTYDLTNYPSDSVRSTTIGLDVVYR